MKTSEENIYFSIDLPMMGTVPVWVLVNPFFRRVGLQRVGITLLHYAD